MRNTLQPRPIPWLGIVCLLFVGAIAQASHKGSSPNSFKVELFPFVGTSFVEIFPEDFTDPASPLFGETQEGFLLRIRSTPPYIFPEREPMTGAVVATIGGNISGEPVAAEHNGRLVVRVEALGVLDSPSVPFRFNGLIDSEEAIRELDFFADRVLVNNCGIPQSETPMHYSRLDPPRSDSLTTITGLDLDGILDNCTIVDNPATHEDESLACDAENIPGPDNASDITREEWSPRTPVGTVTLGRFLKAHGSITVQNRSSKSGKSGKSGKSDKAAGDVASVKLVARNLLPGAVYTVFDVQTDPLARPLPGGFPTGGAPANTVFPDKRGKVNFSADLIRSPFGAELLPFTIPGLGTVDLPASATVTMLLVWQTNGQTAGGLDSTVHIGGGLPGG